MTVTIKFLGAAGTVTGSKYLIQSGSHRLLIDCGLFQGDRFWREKNWLPPDIDLGSISCVLLTHAHIDHVGMLPRYFKLGLRCPILCTQATAQLTRLVLLDSGRLQEEEALYRSENRRSRHEPPLPLYTEADAQGCLELLKIVPWHEEVEVLPKIKSYWSRMGHIIGAGAIQLSIENKIINFSGDIGRYSVPILLDPEPMKYGDLLLVESTYGDRLHSKTDPQEALKEVINRTYSRGGVLLIPSFAVGRAQTLLYYLRELKEKKAIPDLPIVVDSPMADDATSIYMNNPEDYDEEALGIIKAGKHPFSVSKLAFCRDRFQSIKLNSVKEPMIIISASGMLTGGRILHHLKHRLGYKENTVLFVGFQPPGSRGDYLKKGTPIIRVLGVPIEVKAEIAEISGFSAHGDRDELIRWCRSGSGTPGRVAVVHGEPTSANSFASTLRENLHWRVDIPAFQDEWEV